MAAAVPVVGAVAAFLAVRFKASKLNCSAPPPRGSALLAKVTWWPELGVRGVAGAMGEAEVLEEAEGEGRETGMLMADIEKKRCG